MRFFGLIFILSLTQTHAASFGKGSICAAFLLARANHPSFVAHEKTHAEAAAELKRLSVSQFDPNVRKNLVDLRGYFESQPQVSNEYSLMMPQSSAIYMKVIGTQNIDNVILSLTSNTAYLQGAENTYDMEWPIVPLAIISGTSVPAASIITAMWFLKAISQIIYGEFEFLASLHNPLSSGVAIFVTAVVSSIMLQHSIETWRSRDPEFFNKTQMIRAGFPTYHHVEGHVGVLEAQTDDLRSQHFIWKSLFYKRPPTILRSALGLSEAFKQETFWISKTDLGFSFRKNARTCAASLAANP